VYYVEDPLGTPVVNTLTAFTADTTGWREISVGGGLVTPGVTFDVFAQVQEPDPTPTVFTGNWDYTTPQIIGIPASGTIIHPNSSQQLFQIHKTDNDAVDRSADLATLDVGDVIEDDTGFRWAIQAIVDQGTYYNFSVAPAAQNGPDGVRSFNFETVTATPITYMEDPLWWQTNQPARATVFGLFKLESDPTSVADNAYGLDVLFQQLDVSDDWDLLATSGNVSGGDEGGGQNPLPPGGLTDQALTKIDGQDYNVEWSGPYALADAVDTLQYRESFPTGVFSGAAMSEAGTVLTVAAGTGIIVDTYTDPLNPVYTPVSWVEQTIDFGLVTSRQFSYPYIDSGGVLGFDIAPPQPNLQRQRIYLGRAVHDVVVGDLTVSRPAHMLPGQTSQMFADLLYAIKVPFLFEGGKVNPNPNLTFATEDSRWFGPAESWQQDKDDPNIANNPGSDPQTFFYIDALGNLLGAGTTLVDPTQYEDPLGTITTIPGSNNRASIQRLWTGISGTYIMQYGQEFYDNLSEAVSSLRIDESTFTTNPYVNDANATLVAYFIVEKGATNLADGTDVVILDPEGIPIGGGGSAAHNHDATYLRLDVANDPLQAPLSMGGNQINEVADPTLAQDAATKAYVDGEIGALPPPFSGSHADLTGVTPSQHHIRYADSEAVSAMGTKDDGNPLHHDRYTDAEAIAAVGPHFSGDHSDLTGVTPDQHHTRYTDAEAIAAVGPHFSGDHADLTNVLPDQHHARYTDAEAIAAVGPHFSGDHGDLTNVLPDQHHTRYTDAEAIDALGPTLANYLPLSGGVMTGFLTLNAAPTAPLHAATKQYVDENSGGGVTDHDELLNVTSSQHHVRYADSEALAAMGDLNDLNTYNHDRYTDAEAVDALQNTLALYLPLSGGVMTGPIDMGGNQVKDVADPTDLQDAVTRAYFEANDVGTVHTVSTSAPVNPSVGDVWVDPSALGENEYLRLIGGTMVGDINMSSGVGLFWPSGQGISDAFDSTLRLYSDTQEVVRISGSAMEMFGDLFVRGNIVDRPYLRTDTGSAGLPVLANRAESNTGLYFESGGRVNYAGQGAYALGFARSDFQVIPSGSNPAIIRFGVGNVGGFAATAAIESSWGTGSMPQIGIGVVRDSLKANTIWRYDNRIYHQAATEQKFTTGDTVVTMTPTNSGTMIKINGPNSATLGFFRDAVATKWRFAVGAGGFLLQKAADGVNWVTVETWT
jgi:hypothetical protein